MRPGSNLNRPRPSLVATAALALLLGLGACTLDEVDIPPVSGPAETGYSVQLQALPDIINADGVTESIVHLWLRDLDGRPASGRAVYFAVLQGDGALGPAGTGTFVGPVQTGIVMGTNSEGQASAVYVAGFSPGTAIVGVRPYSFDAQGDFLRTVTIIQR